jgi:hypothetical protein
MAAFALVNGAGHYYTATRAKWSADMLQALWFRTEQAAAWYAAANNLPATVKAAEGL